MRMVSHCTMRFPDHSFQFPHKKEALTESIEARNSTLGSSKCILIEALLGETVHGASNWRVARKGHSRPRSGKHKAKESRISWAQR